MSIRFHDLFCHCAIEYAHWFDSRQCSILSCQPFFFQTSLPRHNFIFPARRCLATHPRKLLKYPNGLLSLSSPHPHCQSPPKQTDHLRTIEAQATLDRERARVAFTQWAASKCPDAHMLNISSNAQIAQVWSRMLLLMHSLFDRAFLLLCAHSMLLCPSACRFIILRLSLSCTHSRFFQHHRH